nr:MAG TPA: hypothetical protein [Caudoviricetes sp.]DAV08016.1 MAG TPA: hypothetical protein [Caudoviricetes sp.]DAV75992.1 MAG TPA: hypothetical protein [Caudoviricetes sp.]
MYFVPYQFLEFMKLLVRLTEYKKIPLILIY